VKLFLKNLLFSLLIPGSVAVYIPLIITRARGITTYLLCLVIGFLLMALGVIIYTWTVWDFASFGKGTPLPIDAPKKLVVRGLYCYSRNPMYLGVMMVILGWAGVLANSWLFVYAFVVGIVVHLFVVGYEEPKLKELFGEEYETYRAAVNRWIPSIR
jgi:protein-S-isoprenylcysteine O-methyltransferase Ste14